MANQTQDTHPQDPIDRFALHVEGLRRMRVPCGVAWIVHRLLVAFFAYLLKVAADIVEQRRNGMLPDTGPARAPEQARSWPADLRARASGRVQQRSAHGRVEQPQIIEPIVEAPCEQHAVERRVTANLYRWLPLTPTLSLKGRGGRETWKFDSTKRVFADGDTRVRFITISQQWQETRGVRWLRFGGQCDPRFAAVSNPRPRPITSAPKRPRNASIAACLAPRREASGSARSGWSARFPGSNGDAPMPISR
jgi:hypothetical protein